MVIKTVKTTTTKVSKPPAPKQKKANSAAPKSQDGGVAKPLKRAASNASEAPPPKKAKVVSEDEDVFEKEDDDSGCSLKEQEKRAAALLKKKGKLTCDDVLKVLEVMPVQLTDARKNVLPEGVEKVRGFALGSVTERLTGCATVCQKTGPRANLSALLCRFMKEHEPSFTFTTIQVNKNYAAKRHVDGNNLGDSRIIGFGDYIGGKLLVEEKGKMRQCDIKNTFAKFNGNDPHEVTQFQGTRFSLVFFTLGNYRTLTTPIAAELKKFGFPVPTGKALGAYKKGQEEKANEKGTRNNKESIQKDIDRLKKELVKVLKPWEAIASDEVLMVAGGYDILPRKDIARIKSPKNEWIVKFGLSVALLKPADMTFVEQQSLNFYAELADSTKKIVKLAARAKTEDLVFLVSTVDSVVKQNVPLTDAFYKTMKDLGAVGVQRIGYRRPFCMAAWKGKAFVVQGERNELARLVVRVKAKQGKLELVHQQLKNMASSGDRDADDVVPLAPSFVELNTTHTVVRKGFKDYRIVIPSYDRPQKLKDATLKLLEFHDVPLERIYVFVANNEELAKYSKMLGDKWKLRKSCNETRKGEGNLVVGVLRIAPQRTFIAKFFEEGKYLVSMDDDLSGIEYMCKDEVGDGCIKTLPKGEFQKLIEHGGDLMLRARSKLWSVNTSGNPLSMHATHISRRAGVCNGYLYGFINRYDDAIFPKMDDAAEDVERSARYFMSDGVVLRYRMIRCATKCYDEKGGLQKIYEDRKKRKAAELSHVERIANLFPNLVCVNEARAEAQAEGVTGHRALPVHFLSQGDPPLAGKKAPWKYPASEIEVSATGSVTERVESLAGRR